METGTDSKFNTIIAIVISILTIFSALLGWQMGNVTGDAEGEYAAAQRAELNTQKIQSINALAVDENHRSFLNYKRNYDEYLLVSQQLEQARSADAVDESLIVTLETKQEGLRALYISNLQLFPNMYIAQDGTYDTSTQLGQLYARAARDMDLNSQRHLNLAVALDAQVQRMQYALVLLAVSLFFFAVISTVEALKPVVLWGFTALGAVFSVAGLVIGVLNLS